MPVKQPWETSQFHLTSLPDGMDNCELASLSDEELAKFLQKPICYRVSDGFVTREIAGEVLAVPVGAQVQKLNGMITFSEAGALLWKLLEKPRTKEDLAMLLAAEYGKEPAEVKDDVNEFIDRALERGLIVKCE